VAQKTTQRRKKSASAAASRPAKRARKTRRQLEDERDHRLIQQAEREGQWIPWKEIKREFGL